MKWKGRRKKVGKNFHNFRTRQIAKPKSDIFSVVVGKYVKKRGIVLCSATAAEMKSSLLVCGKVCNLSSDKEPNITQLSAFISRSLLSKEAEDTEETAETFAKKRKKSKRWRWFQRPDV